MTKLSNNSGLSASEVGLEARQTVVENSVMDDSWRNKSINRGDSEISADIVDSVQDRELRTNQEFREIYRKVQNILNEDSPTQTQQTKSQYNSPRNPSIGLSLDDLMEDLGGGLEQFAEQVSGKLYTDGYNEPTEASMLMEEMHTEARPTDGSWIVEKAQAKLKSGAKIPVWMVNDPGTGMEIKKPFRVQEAAQRIASILNQSGNVNDPRAKSVMEAYDKHVSLMKQIRAVRKQIDVGHTDKKGRLSVLRERLEQVNYKLGI